MELDDMRNELAELRALVESLVNPKPRIGPGYVPGENVRVDPSCVFSGPITVGDHTQVWRGAEWLGADVLVTDPPYGYTHKSGGGPRGSASWKNTSIANDHDTTARDDVLAAWGEKPAIMFGSWKRQRPAATRALLIWDKGGHAGMGDLSIPWKPNFEDIYIMGGGFKGKRESGVLGGYHVPANEAAGRTHPHEKPANLMSTLIAKCPDGVVADPFSGSGTTLYAAKSLGRQVVGVELEERYCEVIAKRCSQEVLDLGWTA